MKSIFRLLLMLLVATALAVPSESAAQSVCEGLTTVLKKVKSRDAEELEFYTLPGASCQVSGWSGYLCDWPVPGPGLDALTSELHEWERNVSNEMKKLAGAFQQCIDQKKVPYNWDSFEKERKGGRTKKYYIYTKPFPRMSVVLCLIEFDHRLPVDRLRAGARLRLMVHKGHKDDCETWRH